MDWLFRREVLTDQEIDLIKVMEVKKEAGHKIRLGCFLNYRGTYSTKASIAS